MIKLYALLFLFTFLTTGVSAHRCFHGTPTDHDRCECEYDYIGEFCERKMNCAGFRRHANRTCVKCATGYQSPDCVWKACGKNGKLQLETNLCICVKPYTGEFCGELKREEVLIYYNRKVAHGMGVFGGLIIFPLIALYWSCNELARRRKVKRVEKTLEDAVESKKSVAAFNLQRQNSNDRRLEASVAESLLRRNLARQNDL